LSGFAFGEAPLSRADALRDDAHAMTQLWPRAKVLVLDENGTAFADADGALLVYPGASLRPAPDDAVLLGLDGDLAWFAIDASSVGVSAPQRIDLRRAASEWPSAHAAAFAFARAMQHWRSRSRFCGACAEPLEFRRGGYVAHCVRCARDNYPRVDPAVIVAVSDGQRLLLGRQPGWPDRRFSVVAGFVEPGESPEQTVAREVFEETRVRVRSSRYLGAQPWPFPGALMLGFIADAEADPPQVDGELEEARWFSVEEIGAARTRGSDERQGILLSPRISIARSLIDYWYEDITTARRAAP
jgi:NAD+ diphosphatase